MDYLAKYGVKNYRRFQEGGAMAPPPGPESAAPAGGGGEVEAAAQLLMQIAQAAMEGDEQAAAIAVQIAQAVAGGGEGGAPVPEQGMARNGSPVYRNGGALGAPVFQKRTALVPRR